MNDKGLLIQGGMLIDPSQRIHGEQDILVKDGKIAELGKNLKAGGADIFDASGKLVMPGLIDMHTHLREPGFEEAETIMSGCEAAAAGGFAQVMNGTWS